MLDLVSCWIFSFSFFRVCPVRYPSRVQKFYRFDTEMFSKVTAVQLSAQFSLINRPFEKF